MAKVDLTKAPYNLDEEAIKWVEDTIAGMSVDEKIGQLFFNMGSSAEEDYLKSVLDTYHIAGVRYNKSNAATVYEQNRILQENSKVPVLIAANTEEMKNRIADFTSNYPFLIAEDQGKMLGYAYAHAFGDRPAYRYTAELSIYTKHTDKGRGIGRQLYQALEDQLKKQGIVNAVAVVTGSNTNSLAFHQKLGYKIIGRLPQAGYKFGHWEDTVWLYKQLARPSTPV